MQNEQDLRTLEQKIEDAHQRLLSIDQQYARIKKFHSAEESEVEQLQQIKADLILNVADLKEKKDKVVEDISKHLVMKDELTSNLDLIKDNIKVLKAQIETDTTNNEKINSKLKERQDTILTKENELSDREEKVSEREKSTNEKYNKLKAFTSSI